MWGARGLGGNRVSQDNLPRYWSPLRIAVTVLAVVALVVAAILIWSGS